MCKMVGACFASSSVCVFCVSDFFLFWLTELTSQVSKGLQAAWPEKGVLAMNPLPNYNRC